MAGLKSQAHIAERGIWSGSFTRLEDWRQRNRQGRIAVYEWLSSLWCTTWFGFLPNYGKAGSVMVAIEWIAVALIFGAIYGAYALGRGNNPPVPSGGGRRQIRQYMPPVDVVLEYRNEAGIRMSRRVAVLRSLRHHDGRPGARPARGSAGG